MTCVDLNLAPLNCEYEIRCKGQSDLKDRAILGPTIVR